MIFEITRNLEDKVFTTSLKFKAFGGVDIDELEEKTLVNDFGAPEIDLGKIDFTGKYKLDAGKLVEDEVAGEVVTFVLNSKKIKADDKFIASYTVDAKRLSAQTVIDTPALVAEAQCLVFEKKIKDALAAKVLELKSKSTSFEKSAPIEVTI